MPSDGTLWTTLRDPAANAIRVLMMLPIVSAVLFVLLFFLMDRRDEYQLVNYITKAKSFQSIGVGMGWSPPHLCGTGRDGTGRDGMGW